ncbi:MAG: diphthine--ammonia ligase [Methanosarcinales archaeon]|nr:diphthine--ammonia ligase [Methanosarcinales archaeon]
MSTNSSPNPSLNNSSPNNGIRGRVVVSWTGGKDGALSFYKAVQAGYQVSHLLHFKNARKQGSHDINPHLLTFQAAALGVGMIQRDFLSYEEEFKRVVGDLRKQGARIDGAVFGHIETHKNLVDRICRDMDLELLMPLWNRDSNQIIAELIEAGFEVMVSSVKADLLGPEWLGRKIDRDFAGDLRRHDRAIDPCGENGEFHTFVTDGPLFKNRLKIAGSRTVLREGYWFLDVSEFESIEK